MTAAISLLDFILRLLKDPQAQAEFRANPEQVLAANGLTGVSAADIHETLPLVTDNRFVALNNSHAVSSAVLPPAEGNRIHAAVHYLHQITRTYRYDDHGAHAHDPGHVNIWATGDVTPRFDGHEGAHGSFPGPAAHGPGGTPGTGNWAGDSHGDPGHQGNFGYGDGHTGQSYADPQGRPGDSSPNGAFRHSSHDQGHDLHSFGSGATTTSASATGNPPGYSGGTAGSHDSTGFHYADSGAASQTAPDDSHTNDAHSSFGDSYYGHDSYYGQDTEHGAHDPPESHIYLDLH
jgi:hypothetical protein